MAFSTTLYNLLFKRSSTFTLTIVVGAFVMETAINESANAIFETINRGKLWHHIKDNYTPKE